MNYEVSYDRVTEAVENGVSRSLQVAKAGEHLVCAELILQGYNAFISDAGLPYDILVDLGDHFITIQVKSTCKLYHPKNYQGRKYSSPVYKFAIRRSRTGNRRVDIGKINYFAFVALDRRLIAFLPSNDVVTKDGTCKMSFDFKTRQIEYKKNGFTGRNPNGVGKFIEDYWAFNYKPK